MNTSKPATGLLEEFYKLALKKDQKGLDLWFDIAEKIYPKEKRQGKGLFWFLYRTAIEEGSFGKPFFLDKEEFFLEIKKSRKK